MSMNVCKDRLEIPEGYFIAECAVSGGTMEEYLQRILAQSEGRLCVTLRPVFQDFSLPDASGEGVQVTIPQMQTKCASLKSYFSESLCTEYCTWIENGTPHVFLYDSQHSLQEKYNRILASGIPLVLIEDDQLRSTLLKGEKSTSQK